MCSLYLQLLIVQGGYKIYVCNYTHICFDNSCTLSIIIKFLLSQYFGILTLFSIGEATATGGDITLKTVKDATWDACAKWYHLAINLDVDFGTIDVSIVQLTM